MTTAAARPVRCGRCKSSYSRAAFDALPKLVTLAHDELTPIVSEWPAGVIVEVRECKGCATPIACLASPPHARREDAVR